MGRTVRGSSAHDRDHELGTSGGQTDACPPDHGDRDRALLSSLGDVVLVRDADGVVTYCSPSALVALGHRPSDVQGTPERDLIHPSDVDARDDLIAGTRSGGAPLPPIELRMRDGEGEWRWFESIEINCLDDPDVAGIISQVRDVSARKAATQDLLDRCLRDPLTGIPNRLALLERLGIALSHAVRSRDVLAVIFCDLDDFKFVNDGFGHEFGDGVLMEVARRLEELQRRSDTVARLGGDEFVVVCEGLHDADESNAIAARIQAAIEAPIVIDGRQCQVTASIGIATIDGRNRVDADPAMLLRNADSAMYRAKRHGRARWQRFDDALVAAETRRFELEQELKPALAANEFVLHFQPIHELAGNTIVGVEAFLRWEHPTRGFLVPSDFLEIAEQNGMIVPIGAWVMRAACAQARQWRDAGWRGWMSVNLSGPELAQAELAQTVATTLEETGLEADQLWLELSEDTLLHAVPSAMSELAALRALGAHVGIANFGKGHTRLRQLQQLSADFVKIDATFVADLTDDCDVQPAGRDIVAALVQVGRTLGLSVIADGIQSELQRALLVECGCDYGQGELLAVPVASPVPEPLRHAPAPGIIDLRRQ